MVSQLCEFCAITLSCAILQAIADGIYYYQGVVKLETLDCPSKPVFAQPQAADFAFLSIYVNMSDVYFPKLFTFAVGL